MRKIFRQPQVVIGAVILMVAAPAALAQQANAPATDPARTQMEAFERSLLGAIDSAAGELTRRVREALPGQNIVLQYQSQPVVTGVMIPDVGPVFHVLIPAIEDLSLSILKMNWLRNRQNQVPTQSVGNTGSNRVGSAAVVEPDPVLPPVLANPDSEYTTLARESLIVAVLESALSLPVPPNQHLTVIAGELPPQPLTPFYQRSRMLILQLKGEDLLALRENRISKDDARKRIKESKFPN